MTRMEPILDTQAMRLWHRPGPGPYLFVVFSGVGTDPSARPDPEFIKFFRETPQHSALFVADDMRCWLNSRVLVDAVRDAVLRIRDDRPDIVRVVTLGNSMGGFSAIALTDQIGAQTAIAFTPQFSVHPGIVPNERRWKRFRKRIAHWHVADLSDRFSDEVMHFVFHGADPMERQHWQPMPMGPHVQHYIFPQYSHFIVRPLRQAGLLHPIVALSAARRPRRVRMRVETMGAMKRKHFERQEMQADAASPNEETDR